MSVIQISVLAYILGLLLTGLSGKLWGIPAGAIAMLLGGAIAALAGPRFWRTGIKPRIWLLAGLIGCLAALYFQIRLPQPQANDICHVLNPLALGQPIAAASGQASGQISGQTSGRQTFEVWGTIATAPRLTRSDRLRFHLEAAQVAALTATKAWTPQRAIAGSVYVTLPKSKAEALYPGQRVVIRGSLYPPKPATSPGGFDFQKHLQQEGIFTGLTGQDVRLEGSQPDPPILWAIRRRIVRSQAVQLGITEGHLVSAMVMGKSAVDVPYELQDEFRQAGLAHALAASGAQVSMLIGVILALTQRLSARWRSLLGALVLLGYIGLTGIEPSVLRAGVMGGVVLLAMTIERQVKPIGSLLFAASLLLLINPLWIWDLGFQLSFLATLGLLVTVPTLTQWLDWVPSAIAPLIGVPIAAYLWTLPLQLFTFGIVSPYSILVNVVVSPLIAIISIGGMLSAVAALISPLAGSGLAWLLHYPTWLFIQAAAWGNQLPGSQYAVGTIAPMQVLALYGLILLVWKWRRSHPHWWLAMSLGIGLVAFPAWAAAANFLQVTVLPTSNNPVLVIQDRGQVILINSGQQKDAQLTVLPFLQKQGINRIDWAIAPHLRTIDLSGWQQILETLPIRMFYGAPAANQDLEKANPEARKSAATGAIAFSRRYQAFLEQVKAHQGEAIQLSNQMPLQLASLHFKLLTADAAIWQFQIGDQTWLFLNALRSHPLPQAQVLWWVGRELQPRILQQVQPKVAIASKLALQQPSQTQAWLSQRQTAAYFMDQTGAVQWSPGQGFTTVLESNQEP